MLRTYVTQKEKLLLESWVVIFQHLMISLY